MVESPFLFILKKSAGFFSRKKLTPCVLIHNLSCLRRAILSTWFCHGRKQHPLANNPSTWGKGWDDILSNTAFEENYQTLVTHILWQIWLPGMWSKMGLNQVQTLPRALARKDLLSQCNRETVPLMRRVKISHVKLCGCFLYCMWLNLIIVITIVITTATMMMTKTFFTDTLWG